MEPFAYRPLLQASNSTRLLQIQPGAEGSDIHCLLHDHTIRLDRASGPYEALSYVWGDPTEKRRIYIQDGQSAARQESQASYLDITVNLYIALQRLRDFAFPRIMWIDAVCIDQQNLQERATQVRFMATIYAHASRVVVWFGEGKDDSTRTFAAIEQAAVRDRRRLILGQLEDYSPASQALAVSHAAGTLETSLVAMLARPWFHRIWVLQEVAAARHLAIMCGEAEITGDSFTRGLPACLEEIESPSRNLGATLVGMMGWEAPQSANPEAPSSVSRLNIMSLGQLLDRFHLHKATDQRDKVFALLGICGAADHITDPPLPDYTRSWSSVFRDVISYLLGPQVKATTWDNLETAMISGPGFTLGQVTSVQASAASIRPTSSWGRWTADVQPGTSCKEVMVGDILWQMDGATFPCIVRFCGDHFDLILVAAHVFQNHSSVPWRRLQRKAAATELNTCSLNSQRHITMIWDWTPKLRQTPDDHGALLEADCTAHSSHPSCEARMSDCARVLDDLGRWEDLRALIATAPAVPREPGLQRHLELLALVCSQLTSYKWLIKYMEELHWGVYGLQRAHLEGRQFYNEELYDWMCEGYFALDVLDIDALSKRNHKISVPSAEERSNYWVVLKGTDEADHYELLSGLFPAYAEAADSVGTLTHDALNWNGRYLVCLMLAQDGLTSTNFPHDEASLTPILQKLSSIPHNLSSIRHDGSWHDYVALMLISELCKYGMIISRDTLEQIAQEEGGARVLFFLLAESYKNIQLVYDILAVVCRGNLHRDWIEESMPGIPLYHISDDDTWIYGRLAESSVLWLHANFSVINTYVQHTDLCEIAHATPDDEVLGALDTVFGYLDPDSDDAFSENSGDNTSEYSQDNSSDFSEATTHPADVRSRIVRGMHEFIEEQVAFCDFIRTSGACEDGQLDESLSKPESGVLLINTFWDEYLLARQKLDVPGEVRGLLETCIVRCRGKQLDLD